VNTQIAESPDVIAWNRARVRQNIELACAVAAGLAFIAMFAAFYSILTT
jgi:hypothetical protein